MRATDGGAAVDITGAAGTGQSFIGQVPDDIVSAMLLIIGHLYERRENTSDFEVFDIPQNAESLLAPYRIVRFC